MSGTSQTIHHPSTMSATDNMTKPDFIDKLMTLFLITFDPITIHYSHSFSDPDSVSISNACLPSSVIFFIPSNFGIPDCLNNPWV